MQDGWQAPIDYAFHKAQAKRLRAAAIDGLFRRLGGLAWDRGSWRAWRLPRLQAGAQ
jgi:hypothetical protein